MSVFDQNGQAVSLPKVVYDKAGHPFELIPTYAVCETTDTRQRSSKPINTILIGVSASDYQKAQSYRRDVEKYIIEKQNCSK